MAMKTEQKIYAASGVLVVLLVGLWVANKSAKDEAMAHSLTAASATLPEIKLPADDADKITKIEIKNAGKGEVVLEKQGENWKLTKPVDYPANQQNVKTLIDNIKEIRVKDSIDTGKSQYATYDLEDDKAVHVQLYKDTTKAVDLYFGKSGTRGQMTRVADKDGVYVASGYSNYLYTRDVKDWRDRIVKFQDGASSRITQGTNGHSASKGDDKWTGTFKARRSRFRPGEGEGHVAGFKTLSADDLPNRQGSADTGLDKRRVQDEGRRGHLKLNVGKGVRARGVVREKPHGFVWHVVSVGVTPESNLKRRPSGQRRGG
jgi:hypothetical protein